MPPLFPFPLQPTASTSRLPPLPLPSPHLRPRPRYFSSTPPSHSPHLLHPTTRLRLTNLTFYLCAIVSITTVSLTMSGSIGNGSVVGCPARPSGGRVGVGAQEEMREREKGKGKGKSSRWLEDPVPISRREEVVRPTRDGRLEKVEKGERIVGKESEEEDSAIGWRSWVARGATSRRGEARIGEGKDGREIDREGFAEGEGRVV